MGDIMEGIDIGKEIRVARAKLGISQREAAEIMARHQPRLSAPSWTNVISFAEQGYIDDVLETLVGKGDAS